MADRMYNNGVVSENISNKDLSTASSTHMEDTNLYQRHNFAQNYGTLNSIGKSHDNFDTSMTEGQYPNHNRTSSNMMPTASTVGITMNADKLHDVNFDDLQQRSRTFTAGMAHGTYDGGYMLPPSCHPGLMATMMRELQSEGPSLPTYGHSNMTQQISAEHHMAWPSQDNIDVTTKLDHGNQGRVKVEPSGSNVSNMSGKYSPSPAELAAQMAVMEKASIDFLTGHYFRNSRHSGTDSHDGGGATERGSPRLPGQDVKPATHVVNVDNNTVTYPEENQSTISACAGLHEKREVQMTIHQVIPSIQHHDNPYLETSTPPIITDNDEGAISIAAISCDKPVKKPVSFGEARKGLLKAIAYLKLHPDMAGNHIRTLRKVLKAFNKGKKNKKAEKKDVAEEVEDVAGPEEEDGISKDSTVETKFRPLPKKYDKPEKSYRTWKSRPHRCTVCYKRFVKETNLEKHFEKCSNKAPAKCDLCDKQFNTAWALTVHQRMHTGEKPYLCTICGNSFTQKDSLLKHQTVHTGELAYKCTVCDKRFARANYLKTHMVVHSDERSHMCPQCGKSYRRSCELQIHMRIHTDDRRYKCTHCDKAFTRLSTLNDHVKTHTGVKPHKCPTCGQGFAQACALRMHKLIHTGERPYRCTVCGEAFSHSGSLYHHKKIHSENRKPRKRNVAAAKAIYPDAHLLTTHWDISSMNQQQ